MILRLTFCLAVTAGLAGSAHADAPRPAPLPRPAAGPATVFSFARENPDCGEWSDACRSCVRGEGDAYHCSTPGIACTPGPPVCRVTRSKPAP